MISRKKLVDKTKTKGKRAPQVIRPPMLTVFIFRIRAKVGSRSWHHWWSYLYLVPVLECKAEVP